VSTDWRISVVIAAHNEAAVIGRCLDALLAGADPGQLDVTVVANGCTDDTAAVAASRPGVRVIDRPEPGKVGALNAGDAVAVGFPRIYLDADIVLAPGAVRALAGALDGGVHAAVPRRELDVAGRPLLVRAYYAINARMPVYDRALFGRGVIALSAAGRARFGEFPDVVADDLFLDSLFSPEEKRQVDSVRARIATPRRTRDLVRRLARVRSGNAAIRGTSAGVRPAARSSWLRDVVLPRPWLAPAGICYAAITVVAAVKARRSPATGAQWGRDESSRSSREESHADR
jgi:glycosyltransferase involved in cell wall biosynthesis